MERWMRLGWRLAVRTHIDAERLKLASAETGDARGRQAIQESFVAGYRMVSWVAAGMALASSLSAAVLISGQVSGRGQFQKR